MPKQTQPIQHTTVSPPSSKATPTAIATTRDTQQTIRNETNLVITQNRNISPSPSSSSSRGPMPYEVVRQMMSKGEEAVLGVTPKEVTIFFSDIAGFTTICEAMKPNELLVLLSDYFAAMSAIIVKGRGTLLEFIGDALLVTKIVPILQN